MRRGFRFLNSLFAALLFAGAPLCAFAEEAGAGAEPGLPQLDPRYFPSQAFWLVVAFALIYLLMRYVALPQVESTLDKRAAKIENDVAEAKHLNEEAKRLSAELELRMNDARTHAQERIKEASVEATVKLASALAEQQKKLDEKLRAAQTRLNEQKKQALASLDHEVAGMVDAIVKRLTGAAPANDQNSGARRAVKGA